MKYKPRQNKDFEEMKQQMMSHQNANYDEQHGTMRSVTYGRVLTKQPIKE